jgi:hypothetical protein
LNERANETPETNKRVWVQDFAGTLDVKDVDHKVNPPVPSSEQLEVNYQAESEGDHKVNDL